MIVNKDNGGNDAVKVHGLIRYFGLSGDVTLRGGESRPHVAPRRNSAMHVQPGNKPAGGSERPGQTVLSKDAGATVRSMRR